MEFKNLLVLSNLIHAHRIEARILFLFHWLMLVEGVDENLFLHVNQFQLMF